MARLRLGLEHISGYEHHLRLMVAEGDTVVTEHAETWRWHTGEEVTLPFVSVPRSSATGSSSAGGTTGTFRP